MICSRFGCNGFVLFCYRLVIFLIFSSKFYILNIIPWKDKLLLLFEYLLLSSYRFIVLFEKSLELSKAPIFYIVKIFNIII